MPVGTKLYSDCCTIAPDGITILYYDFARDEQITKDLKEKYAAQKARAENKSSSSAGGGPDNICPCGHICVAGCNCACSCGCGKKERKENRISKQDFFRRKEISENYDHVRDGVYQLRKNGNPVVKNAHYLQWDHLHGDVEVYSKSRTHIGSLEPQTLALYKDPVMGPPFPLQ